ncbi:MAG TPA: 50S ribosomal protein L33 [Caldithrix abyssi]|uniref:Large ribosomal subunit protein bL33 n=1 Tax=Caldithrix abyssi TaxID=187145 RepID=A0A7V1PUZ5_CALAY|nr:50S ribosomal protein L33 [Caldithrix abyssi]
MRITVFLECTVCKNRNYRTQKNKATQSERLEQKKYCPRCNARTLHRESK